MCRALASLRRNKRRMSIFGNRTLIMRSMTRQLREVTCPSALSIFTHRKSCWKFFKKFLQCFHTDFPTKLRLRQNPLGVKRNFRRRRTDARRQRWSRQSNLFDGDCAASKERKFLLLRASRHVSDVAAEREIPIFPVDFALIYRGRVTFSIIPPTKETRNTKEDS